MFNALAHKAVIKGGTPEQQNEVRRSLKQIDATSNGQELDVAIGNADFKIGLKAFDPLNANARVSTRTLGISFEFVDGTVCCYTSNPNSGESSYTLDRVLTHEIGHLAGTRDDGVNSLNNVNRWENPIMRQIAPSSSDRTAYGFSRPLKKD